MAKINGKEFLIGADPEIFVTDARGALVSAYGLVPGTKEAPYKVAKGAVQVDGMALEFNINPADNPKEFKDNLNTVMNKLEKMISPHYKFAIEPVAEFGLELINEQPKEARELGCMPDYNAYTGAPNPRPNAEVDFRTASGHVHVGWTKDVDPLHPEHFEACCWLTKVLDAYLGIPSLLWDGNAKRRELYGKAGSFRPKPYGMEYRVLSNAWLKLPGPRGLVFGNTLKAIEALMEDNKVVDRKYYNHSAQEIIDGGMINKAKECMLNEDFPSPKYYRELEEKEAA